MNKHTTTVMRKWKSWGNRTNKIGEDNDLVDQFQLTFSISSAQFLQSVCLHLVLSCVYAFCTLCLSSIHHDNYAYVLLCLHLSTYSAASSSSLRNFLTHKFLSEEFIKIAYSPPSSRYNTLSIGIRARYSLVLCDFGLTAWSFSYVDRMYDQGLCWVSYLRWDGLPLLEE